jgi:hypothetical protein
VCQLATLNVSPWHVYVRWSYEGNDAGFIQGITNGKLSEDSRLGHGRSQQSQPNKNKKDKVLFLSEY